PPCARRSRLSLPVHQSLQQIGRLAADLLRRNPTLKQQLEEKKKTDEAFAKSGAAQLNFVYQNSPYFETTFTRYPVYRLLK
ncbi:MAG: hypothetical protein EAZ29_02435, partial [Runella slithyformis]